ncbi:hypothetical protein Glove_167g9 [Diversispora epigaea]|uniref:Uncharacterized protein n=1 Tax=Diversispora epigaea TaxID=1348612 RepID=A0A397IYI6_9GLOM|nr:hypothetical protein Glove_167g9 [Diversispora epigaea]
MKVFGTNNLRKYYVYVGGIRRFFESNIPRDVLASRNSARTKLLVTHQNIGNLEKKSKSETSVDSNNFESNTELNLKDCLHDAKRVIEGYWTNNLRKYYVYYNKVKVFGTNNLRKYYVYVGGIRRFFESNIPRDVLASRNSARTKLLVTHQNIGNLEKKSKSETSVDSNNFESNTELNLKDCLHDAKRVRIDKSLNKDLVSPEHPNESNELVGYNTEEGGFTKINKNGEKVSRGKGKGPVERSLRSRNVCV